MSKLPAVSRLLSAAAAACLVLAVAAPARAGVIASFDPAFGNAIPNLGFRGSITLDVAQACYTGTGGYINITSTSACQITAQSAQIDFYNTMATGQPTIPNSSILDGSFFAADYVFGALFDANDQLVGFDTNDSEIFNVFVPGNGVDYSGNMVLYFQSTLFQQVGRVSSFVSTNAVQPGFGGAFLRQCVQSEEEESRCPNDNSDNISNPGRLTFTTVPEPDSTALAMLGLGALILARRRSRVAANA